MKLLTFVAAALLCGVAHAQQGVQFSGPGTPGHAPAIVTNSVIKDGGPATQGQFTELGIHKNGGLPFCITNTNNPPPFTSPYAQFCLAVTPSQAQLIINSTAGATVPTPVLVVNGVSTPINTGGAATVTTVTNVAALTSGTFANFSNIILLGYNTAGDGGGGLFSNVVSCTLDSGTCFKDSAGNFFARQYAGALHDSWFGWNAANSATSQTTADQAFITAVLGQQIAGFFDCGTHLENTTFNINTVQPPKISGLGRNCTTLSMQSNNTPIFTFAAPVESSVLNKEGIQPLATINTIQVMSEVTDMSYTWATQQTCAADPLSNVMYFTAPGGGAIANYVFVDFERSLFNNGCYFLFNQSTPGSIPGLQQVVLKELWGGRGMGGFFNSAQGTVEGQASMTWSDIYLYGDGWTNGNIPIHISAFDNTIITRLEINEVTDIQTPVVMSGANVTCNTCAFHENIVYDSSAPANPTLFRCDNGTLTFNTLETGIDTVNIGAGNDIFVVSNLGACYLTINNWEPNNRAVTSGRIIGLGGFSFGTSAAVINNLSPVPDEVNMALTDVNGDTSADATQVTSWNTGMSATMSAGSNFAWTVGKSPTRVLQTNTQTASLAVNITDPNGNLTNLTNGTCLTVLRQAATPGGFTLGITDASSNLIGSVIPIGSNGFRTACYSRVNHAWYLAAGANYATLGP